MKENTRKAPVASRREFLGTVLAGGAAVGIGEVGPAEAARPKDSDEKLARIFRRHGGELGDLRELG